MVDKITNRNNTNNSSGISQTVMVDYITYQWYKITNQWYKITNHNNTNHSSGKSQTTCAKHMYYIYMLTSKYVKMEVQLFGVQLKIGENESTIDRKYVIILLLLPVLFSFELRLYMHVH